MHRVLIVDDDRLVRHGLMSAMPWESYGMRVVGEAGNGEKALAFLAANNVDLLITDLAMPVMSGIELMRLAKERYPALKVVVLSMHQDFEYVQEALRLGAIDYIAKHQLEKERFDEVLARIRQRMENVSESRQAAQSDEWLVWMSTGDLQRTDVMTLRQQMDKGLQLAGYRDKLHWLYRVRENLVEIGNGIWISSLPNDRNNTMAEAEMKKLISLMEGFCLMYLKDASAFTRDRIDSLIRHYRQTEWFYDPASEERFFHKSTRDLEGLRAVSPSSDPGMLRAYWASLEWVYAGQHFNRELDRLRSQRLPESKLRHLLGVVEQSWNDTYGTLADCSESTFGEMTSWTDVCRKLEEMRRIPRELAGDHRHTPEISGCVLRAVRIVKEEYATPLHAGTVAGRVNMSRSHFCQCFKEITGNAFNAHLRIVRMEKARELIASTSLPLQLIAEQVGYQDEKYFSKVFRETTGLLPSEYRKSSGTQGSDVR